MDASGKSSAIQGLRLTDCAEHLDAQRRWRYPRSTRTLQATQATVLMRRSICRARTKLVTAPLSMEPVSKYSGISPGYMHRTM